MYSRRANGELRIKLELSIVMNLAPGVDIVLLNRILATSRLAVGVATFPG
jgi:hypothetical protein